MSAEGSRPIVYLVGAGPGDPDLITLRGLECLRRAEVIIYDRLVDPRLLDYATPSAERIYAGKSAGHHSLAQEAINALLLEKAGRGKIVVRLKGGDPFVLGRGGEEAMALREAGIPFEVVPGVTSAVAAPACAGIPVTHRGLASSFAVVTGHRRSGVEDGQSPIPPLPKADTLVVLMPVTTLPIIVEQLLAQGRPPDTPAALVHWATTPQQKTVVAPLANIAQRAEAEEIRPPATLIVGEVVSLRERMRWHVTDERYPHE
ncbi:MAG: uroporphyrinogen-III C-methyltransferase [Anaerolineae bacterium]